MGFSLPSTEVVGSTAALAPTRSALRAALCAGYTARPNGSVLPTRQRIQTLRSHHRRAFRRKDNPASPSLGFLKNFFEDPFSQKRFLRDGVIEID